MQTKEVVDKFGSDSAQPLLDSVLEHMGSMYTSLGKPEEALPYYQRSLKIQEELHGKDLGAPPLSHPCTVIASIEMGHNSWPIFAKSYSGSSVIVWMTVSTDVEICFNRSRQPTDSEGVVGTGHHIQ